MNFKPGTSELPQDQSRRLVVIQRNPGSGSGRRSGRRELLRLIAELRRKDFQIRMFSRRPLLDQYLMEPYVRSRLRCIVAAGGDGTAVDLVNRHPQIPIALLPLGTENLLAGYLRIRRRGRQVADIIQHGRIFQMDCGTVNGKRFLLMLSAGVDAQVVQSLHAVRKGHIGYISYLWPVVRGFCCYRPLRMEVASADRSHVATGTHVLITNVPVYGFGFRFSPEALPDDGLLDVRVFHGTTRLASLWHAVCVWAGCRCAAPQVTRFRADRLTLVPRVADGHISGSGRIPVQYDGDPGPEMPVQIGIEPCSVPFLVARL